MLLKGLDMGNTLKNEAKANLQAGAVNVTADGASFNPTLSLSFGDVPQFGFPGKFIRGARRAINPVKAAQQDAEVRSLEAASIAEAVAVYRSAFPTFTDAQLFMMVHGYNMSPAQADNVLHVLERAGRISGGFDSRINELPASCVDLDVQGAQTAYDDQLRDIWSKLITQEASTGKARSKRTKSTLEIMDAEDARSLFNVLSFCLWAKVGPRLTPTPIPVLIKTPEDDSWTYNRGAVRADSLNALDSLGILSADEWISFTIQPNQGVDFFSTFGNGLLFNNKVSVVKLHLGQYMLLKPGIELADVIGAPTDKRVIELTKEFLDVEMLWKESGL